MHNKLSLLHFSLVSTLALVSAMAHAEAIRSEGPSSLRELRLVDSGEARAQRLVITDSTGATVLDTDKALPRIKNAYSPHSYDGYIANLISERQGKLAVTDLQGERHTLLSSSAQAGDYLALITREEGNGAYNFNLKFRYDGAAKSFDLTQILLNENNTECDQSLLNTHAVDREALAFTSLSDFDGTRAFDALKDLRLAHQTSGLAAEKLMPEVASSNFDAALKTYKAGNEDELKTLVSYFMAGDEDGACDPESYIVEKYYFPQQVGWSNGLGFLFEQAGYYPEAAELLKHITLKHPDRVVAYLNLADAYWALGKRAQAQEAYNQYYQRMAATQKQSKIPHRVISRK
ncbi:tetratricopeptide repeat protein [Pseudomonas sp. IC_126]|uniref:tetratricopeptide repeat protein n=1 Tax=Pseudomonas sp. IC_126 TaxID=2547400 RepID=UPI00103EEF7A|nr:bacterial transcriptional activator domain-containing protein [Pseudomonas sp. IC_126]TCD18352.1 tetratricopeptide repeat protein [Pseudomonas sp. IC_126]